MKLNSIFIEKDSEVEFKKLSINNLYITNFEQLSDYIYFDEIKISKKLKLNKVDFRETIFHNFNIANTKHISIEKTNFINSKMNDFKWGDISRIKAQKDTFRQLKFINDVQGNIIQANEFHSQELQEYKKELFHSGQSFFKNNIQEKIVFFFNEKISNFSRSWFQPILWFFIISLFLYNITEEASQPILFFQILVPFYYILYWT